MTPALLAREVEWLDVHGLYAERWQGRITPESHQHPAKVQPAVARWLVRHGMECRYWKPGDVCLDVFGGVGGFLMAGAWAGLRMVGCELERRYWQMAAGCDCAGVTKAQWVRYHARGQADKLIYREGKDVCPLCRDLKYVKHSGRIPCSEAHRYEGNFALHRWDAGHPRPVIVCGDSRRLSEIIGPAVAALTSQPFAESINDSRPKGGMVARGKVGEVNIGQHVRYGATPGNLGNLKPGDVGAVVTSQPYAEIDVAHIHSSKGAAHEKMGTVGHRNQTDGYGVSPGNLGNMPTGVLTSQPYATSLTRGDSVPDTPNSARMAEMGGRMLYGQAEGQLAEMPAGDVGAVLTSQPYSGVEMTPGKGGLNTLPPRAGHDDQTGRAAGPSQVGAALTSQPYAESLQNPGGERHTIPFKTGASHFKGEYGESPGQLGAMKAGSAEAAITSQPFGDQVPSHDNFVPPHDTTNLMDTPRLAGQDTPGNLAALPMKGAEAAITSQPFEGIDANCRPRSTDGHGNGFVETFKRTGEWPENNTGHYGESPGQLGNERGDTFWEALAQIFRELHKCLRPNGVVVNVVGDFVRAGRRVPLCDDTCRLFEATGFRVIKRVRMWKVSAESQHSLLGDAPARMREQKSFFRRLAESKGSPRIDFEEAIIAVRLPLSDKEPER